MRQVLLYFGFLLGWAAAATSASSIDNEATARIKLLQLVIHAVTKEGEPLIIILYINTVYVGCLSHRTN